MSKQWKQMQTLMDLLGGQVTKRIILVKGIVSFTLLAWWFDPVMATPVAVLGNLVWLWISPENETKFVRAEVAKGVAEIRKELDDVRKQLSEAKDSAKENA